MLHHILMMLICTLTYLYYIEKGEGGGGGILMNHLKACPIKILWKKIYKPQIIFARKLLVNSTNNYKDVVNSELETLK